MLCLLPALANARNDTAEKADSLHTNRKTVCKAAVYTSAYFAGSMLVMGKIWYKDKETVPFHFYNDNGGYLQVDKFGHAFGSYVYSYVGYKYLLKRGLNRKEALMFGATLGLILQTPIEIMDGIHEGYGFSWGDMAANTFGSALVLGQELLFREQLIKYKFSYWETEYARNANGYLGSNTFDRILKDYNGQTYWFSFPANVIAGKGNLPVWLNLAFGYGANGMYGEFENITSYNGVDIPETRRYRQFFFSLDIDWTKIETNSGVLRTLLKGLTFIKLPFPAIEYNPNGQFKGHWLYF